MKKIFFGVLLLLLQINALSFGEDKEPAEKLLRLQPFRPLPPGLTLSPQTVELLSDGSFVLNAALTEISGDKILFDEKEMACATSCQLAFPLSRKTQVHTLTANSESIPILFHWVDLPSYSKKLQAKLSQGAAVKITEDKSGFDPSTYSLLVTADNRLGDRVNAESVASMELRPFSYAASETTEWRLIIAQGETAVANFDGRGELPQFLPLATALGPKTLDPGKYTVRMDIVYAGKFHPGQPVFLEVVSSKKSYWQLGAVAVSGQIFFGSGSSYFSPEARWLPSFQILDNWMISGVFSLSALKDSVQMKTLLYSQFGGRLEYVTNAFRLGLGGGANLWHGSAYDMRPYVEWTGGYPCNPFEWKEFSPTLVLDYQLTSFVTTTHVVRLGVRVDF